jgi:hypothetical protein
MSEIMTFPLRLTLATLASALILGLTASGRDADDKPASAFDFPEDPEDVNTQNPEEALPSFDEFCWKCFLQINRAVSVQDDGSTASPGPLCPPGGDERPAWLSWIDRDTLMQAHPKWQDGVRQKTEAAPAGSTHKLRWAASTLDNLAKPGRFAAGALVDINAPGDMPDTFVGPLVDQGRHFVRYEIRFNRIAYEFARRSKLYDREYQPSPGQLPAVFPAGSIIVKAAWRPIPNDAAGQAFKKTCFWVPARLYMNGELRTADIGLVGLHVVARTPKRPQWIWSSFEHVDNVPNGDKPEPGKSYSFNYGASPTGTVPHFANADPNPNLSEKRTPIALAEKHNHGEGTAKLTPMQVVREKPIHEGTRDRNRTHQTADGVAGTVWANYQLVVTQYPTRPHDDGSDPPGAPFPSGTGEFTRVSHGPGGEERRTPMSVNVANTTMETYFQSVSCMDCHSKAGRYGIDYVYSFGRTFKPEPDAVKIMAARTAMNRPGWEISARESAAVRDTIETFKVRDEVSALDRRSLAGAFGKLSAPTDDGPLDNRPSAIRRPMAAAAPEKEVERDFQEVHAMFADQMRKWANQKGENCPPEMAKRHGEAFGWTDRPWRSWKELEEARFAPGRPASEGLPLIDKHAKAVSEMLLIKVLRGEQVAEAKNKQMPLNGPYFDPKQIDWLVEQISKKYNIPPRLPARGGR